MLTMPACHTDGELRLAQSIATWLDCDELHVFWTEGTFPPSQTRSSTGLGGFLGALLDRLGGAGPG